MNDQNLGSTAQPAKNAAVETTSELPVISNANPTACCGGIRTAMWSMGGIMVVMALALAYFAGFYAANSPSAEASQLAKFASAYPEINASSAVTSEKFSMATGQISDDAEGLVVLDHNSGLLQVKVVYPRSGQYLAAFTTQVGEALGTGGKATQYLLLTGQAGFPRSSNKPIGASVIYVMDASTGNYVCYGVPFQQQLVARNAPQTGILRVIASGSANPLIDRDALR